jgi:hypothetical protein
MTRLTMAAACVILVAAVHGGAVAQGAPAPAYDQIAPTLVYHPVSGEFLAMWSEDRGDGLNIYAKRLFGNGLPQGGAQRDGTAVIRESSRDVRGPRRDPSVVYNSDVDEFYLVWSEERSPEAGLDVYGLRVSTAAYARSSPRLLGGGAGDQSHPSIAYNPDRQMYLVVWEDNTRDVDQIWGVRVRGNGIPNGSPTPLVAETSNAQDPTVARNGDGYLLAWVDDQNGNGDIYARRLNANALPVGGTAGKVYPMANTAEDELAPSLNPASGSLVYNVYNPLTGLDIVGVRVYDTGTTGGSRPTGIAVPAADQANPTTAAGASETVVIYADNRSGGFDIYAVRVANNRPKGRDFAIVQDGYVP